MAENRAIYFALLIPLAISSAAGLVSISAFSRAREADAQSDAALDLASSPRPIPPSVAQHLDILERRTTRLSVSSGICWRRTNSLRETLHVLIGTLPGRASLPEPAGAWPAWPEVGENRYDFKDPATIVPSVEDN